jgi:hypothetical protein
VARALAARGARVTVWDPLAAPAARAELGATVEWATTPGACLADADVAVLAAGDPRVAAVVAEALAGRNRPLVLVDCWRLLDAAALPPTIARMALGVGAPSTPRSERLRALWAEA